MPRFDGPTLCEQDAWLAERRGWTRPASPARRIAIDYDGGRAWFAVRTNPRCEAKAEVSLGEHGFDTFAPRGLKSIIHRRTKKRIEREFMLLTGYVFIAMPADTTRRHWGVVRDCQGVKAPIGIGGEPVAFPAEEIERLRETEAKGMLRLRSALRGPRHDFRVGETLRIGDGPFSGFNGEVVDVSSRKAIRMLIEVFGRATEIEFPIDGPLERI